MNRTLNRSGFTLIELLIVVIIVGVLAVVAVPLMRGNIDRARLSEAEAGLGTIRTAMRAELAETGAYPGTPTLAAIGFNAGDMTGRFFEDDDYAFATHASGYCASVTGDAAGTAVAGDQAVGLVRSMDANGEIYSATACGGTVLN